MRTLQYLFLGLFIYNRNTAQKVKVCIKDFFSKCDQIRRKERIRSHLLKKSLMKNFIFLCSEIRNLETNMKQMILNKMQVKHECLQMLVNEQN